MEPNTLAVVQRTPSAVEVAASASAALAKATIEAKFVIALQRPRSVLNARAAILDACKRPLFAAGARYRKKQGRKEDANGRWVDNYVEGLSIRFAEEAIKAWRNVDVTASTAWEDDERRVVRITVTDLESNLSYADEVTLSKTVERKKVKEGQDVVAVRTNTSGEKVYIVRATDDELQTKVNAAKSKAIRNSGLRLIPQDILEEAEEAIVATVSKGGADPKAEAKKIADAFNSLGVPPIELEHMLGHPLDATQPKELANLRAIYTAIKDGDSTWADYRPKEVEADDVPGAEAPKPAPAPKPANVLKLDPVPPATTKRSPQAELGDLCATSGFTFDDFKAWGISAGHLPGGEDYASYDEVPKATATRLMRNPEGIVKAMAEAKGGGK